MTPTEQGGLTREILLMDNGSTDQTPEVLKSYENHPGVRIIRNKRNLRFNAYKRLFFKARGRIIIDLDDDVLKFPKDFDKTLVEYLDTYKDYGFLGCNVVQDEKTKGSRPVDAVYREDVRGNMVVEEGPVGGWCSAFRRKDYLWIKLPIFLFDITAKCPEDAYLASMAWRLRKRIGIVKNAICLHASGLAYAKEFGHLDREIEKYSVGGMPDLAKKYLTEKKRT